MVLRSNRLMAEVVFKPQDAWVGLFWQHKQMIAGLKKRRDLHLYLCLIPCFPVHVVIIGREEPHV